LIGHAAFQIQAPFASDYLADFQIRAILRGSMRGPYDKPSVENRRGRILQRTTIAVPSLTPDV
jgi:hypothetical protein